MTDILLVFAVGFCLFVFVGKTVNPMTVFRASKDDISESYQLPRRQLAFGLGSAIWVAGGYVILTGGSLLEREVSGFSPNIEGIKRWLAFSFILAFVVILVLAVNSVSRSRQENSQLSLHLKERLGLSENTDNDKTETSVTPHDHSSNEISSSLWPLETRHQPLSEAHLYETSNQPDDLDQSEVSQVDKTKIDVEL